MGTVGAFVTMLTEMVLALVLVAAGAAKLAGRGEFANTLVGLGFPVRRDRALGALAVAIPLSEIGLGISTTIRIAPQVTSLCVVVLTSAFVIVTTWASRRKSHVECRCFGTLALSQFSRAGVIRAVMLFVAAAASGWREWRSELDVSISPLTSVLLVLAYAGFAIAVWQAVVVVSLLGSRREAVQ